MKLKRTKETFITVEYYDLENLICEVTNQDFEILADLELPNDSKKKVNVTGELSKHEQEAVYKFLATGEYSYLTGSLLNYLCKNGHIEPGQYLINVSW